MQKLTVNIGLSKMSRKQKLLFYGVALAVGLAVFILEVFVFRKPDGFLGLLICIASLFAIFVSIIKLCILSEKFKNGFLIALDIFSWLP